MTCNLIVTMPAHMKPHIKHYTPHRSAMATEVAESARTHFHFPKPVKMKLYTFNFSFSFQSIVYNIDGGAVAAAAVAAYNKNRM